MLIFGFMDIRENVIALEHNLLTKVLSYSFLELFILSL